MAVSDVSSRKPHFQGLVHTTVASLCNSRSFRTASVYSKLLFPSKFLHLRFCVRGPQITLRFHKLVEKFTRLIKSVISCLLFNTAEGHKLKSAKGEVDGSKHRRNQAYASKRPSQWSLLGSHLILSTIMRTNVSCGFIRGQFFLLCPGLIQIILAPSNVRS